jgi:hypothetical protein
MGARDLAPYRDLKFITIDTFSSKNNNLRKSLYACGVALLWSIDVRTWVPMVGAFLATALGAWAFLTLRDRSEIAFEDSLNAVTVDEMSNLASDLSPSPSFADPETEPPLQEELDPPTAGLTDPSDPKACHAAKFSRTVHGKMGKLRTARRTDVSIQPDGKYHRLGITTIVFMDSKFAEIAREKVKKEVARNINTRCELTREVIKTSFSWHQPPKLRAETEGETRVCFNRPAECGDWIKYPCTRQETIKTGTWSMWAATELRPVLEEKPKRALYIRQKWKGDSTRAREKFVELLERDPLKLAERLKLFPNDQIKVPSHPIDGFVRDAPKMGIELRLDRLGWRRRSQPAPSWAAPTAVEIAMSVRQDPILACHAYSCLKKVDTENAAKLRECILGG